MISLTIPLVTFFADVWVDRLNQLPTTLTVLTTSTVIILKQIATNRSIKGVATDADNKLNNVIDQLVSNDNNLLARVDALEAALKDHINETKAEINHNLETTQENIKEKIDGDNHA